MVFTLLYRRLIPVKMSTPDLTHRARSIFIIVVLTGEFIRGASGMRVPPAKPTGGPNALYDSVVDNPNSPGMYIIFNDTQAYPEYLITFTN